MTMFSKHVGLPLDNEGAIKFWKFFSLLDLHLKTFSSTVSFNIAIYDNFPEFGSYLFTGTC